VNSSAATPEPHKPSTAYAPPIGTALRREGPIGGPSQPKHHGGVEHEELNLAYCKATLVVCPVVAIIQWRSEIARYCLAGSVKVVVYHGKYVQTPSLCRILLPSHACFPEFGVLMGTVSRFAGAKRGQLTLEELKSADIVLTTYGTLENEHRKYMQEEKVMSAIEVWFFE
jgi:SNF2 family DNA or RNA helicase